MNTVKFELPEEPLLPYKELRTGDYFVVPALRDGRDLYQKQGCDVSLASYLTHTAAVCLNDRGRTYSTATDDNPVFAGGVRRVSIDVTVVPYRKD